MKTKFFDRELYKKYDKLAKNKVVEVLDTRKYKIEENPKKRGVDLLIYRKEDHVLNIETEIKVGWKEVQFPFTDVQIPYRKLKYTELDKPTIFVMFNKTQSSYLVITDKVLRNSPIEEVRNKYCFKEEYFFKVPLKKVNFNGINTVIQKLGV